MAASSHNEFERLTLATGYVAFTVAVLAAWNRPATGYELDLYASTPLAFWIGTGFAALVGVWMAVRRDVTARVRTAALALPVLAVFAVAAIPLLRSFYFFGPGDSLSHLGWARMLAADRLSPLELLYPGIHLTSVFVARVFDVALRRAMQYVVLVFTLLYIVFIPLCVRQITDSRWAVVVGTLLALLLLPINNVSVFQLPYPTGQAIYFIPFMLYLAIRYIGLPNPGTGFPRSVTATGLLLAVAAVAVVLLHPQQAGSVLLVFGGIVAVQGLIRWRWPDHVASRQRPFYAQFLVLAVAFLVWTPRFDRPQGTSQALINGLLGASEIGDEVTRRAGGLQYIGGSVEELFLKIFGVGLVLSVVAGLVILYSFAGRLDWTRYEGTAVQYLSVGHILLTVTFLVFFLGSVSVFPFRYLGALMVLVTVIAAVGLVKWLPATPSWRTLRLVAVVLVTVLIAVQMAHLHESPYIYQSSDQVTETTMEGYESAFQYRDPSVRFAGIRGGPRRFVDATYGTTTTEVTPDGRRFPGKRSAVPFQVFGNNMTEYYDRDRYVPVTNKDVQQEVVLYEGYRYSLSGFRSLRTTPGIHRVRSNGDFRLYYVEQGE